MGAPPPADPLDGIKLVIHLFVHSALQLYAHIHSKCTCIAHIIIKRLAVHYFINLTFQLSQLCVLTRNTQTHTHTMNKFGEYCAIF